MQPYTCGCSSESFRPCDEHLYSTCHRPVLSEDQPISKDPECPACHRERLLSVGIAPALSRFKTWREGEPLVRQAHKDEVDPALGKGSLVHKNRR